MLSHGYKLEQESETVDLFESKFPLLDSSPSFQFHFLKIFHIKQNSP